MRGTIAIRTTVLLALISTAACNAGGGSDTIARAGDFRLEVQAVADLLAPATTIPVDSSVVEAVADFWIDYSLLAWMLNEEGEMDAVDLSALIDQQQSRLLVGRLRDMVIQVDTTITDEELREIYEERRPEDQVRSRHILFSIPPEATPAQRDSVRALAAQVRDRARAGENFATLAQTYSEDPGSAGNGGDLGFYRRGMMVPAFDSASFAMEVGEVSDLIESCGMRLMPIRPRCRPMRCTGPCSLASWDRLPGSGLRCAMQGWSRRLPRCSPARC
jgi:hypothetical protein